MHQDNRNHEDDIGTDQDGDDIRYKTSRRRGKRHRFSVPEQVARQVYSTEIIHGKYFFRIVRTDDAKTAFSGLERQPVLRQPEQSCLLRYCAKF